MSAEADAATPTSARRVAIVTGADRPAGIGAAIARDLLADDWAVLATLRPDAPADADGGRGLMDAAGADGATASGARVATLPVDLADPAAAERVLDAAEALGAPTALIGCAAVSERDGWEALSADGLDRAFFVNARSHALLATGLVRRLAAGAAGRVVLFTSGQGLGPMPDELAYVASKGALEALVLSLAPPFAARGATIHAIDPGPTDTGWMDTAQRRAAVAPDGRVGTPDDVVGLVRFLLSREASRVTGQVLRARGGA